MKYVVDTSTILLGSENDFNKLTITFYSLS